MTDALLTSPAEHTQLLMMVLTLVFVVLLVFSEVAELQCVQLLSHFLCPATVDQFPQLKRSSTVGTLSSLFSQPSPDAAETAQFGTVRAETGITQLFHANEAAEDFRYALNTLLIHFSQFYVLQSNIPDGRILVCFHFNFALEPVTPTVYIKRY